MPDHRRHRHRHLERTSGPTRVVVWAHNSHLGDQRATELAQAGQLNLGQLVRQRYGDETLLIGFTTYQGTVTAASDWRGPAERQRVRRALRGCESTRLCVGDARVSRFLAASAVGERTKARARR
jgi:erythromycin esterase-like protein